MLFADIQANAIYRIAAGCTGISTIVSGHTWIQGPADLTIDNNMNLYVAMYSADVAWATYTNATYRSLAASPRVYQVTHCFDNQPDNKAKYILFQLNSTFCVSPFKQH